MQNAIIYEGPSSFDGKPVVVIATGITNPSRNIKTGPLVTTWTMRSDISPAEATRSGEDASVCGTCILRIKSCYVQIHRAPTMIWKAYKAGRYSKENPRKVGLNRQLRLGGYGDMVAPAEVWQGLVSRAASYVGYTHMARIRPDLKGLVQASADSAEDAKELQAMGWKTFRTKLPEEPLLPGEVYCPNEKTGIQCIQCNACNGKTHNIAINIHGSPNRKNAFRNNHPLGEQQ